MLVRPGILRSFRGRGGGFKLLKPPAKIHLTDVIEVFQGSVDFTGCIFRKQVCRDRANCPLRRKIKQIERHAVDELSTTTIAGLM
jgi:Rrf2 family protein